LNPYSSKLQGQITSKRTEMIRRAYGRLMERFNGEIKFEDLVQAFDEKNHPDVMHLLSKRKLNLLK